MKIKRLIALLTATIVLIAGFGTVSWGASSTVTASLPAFTVTLNGQVIDNSYSQYPLIVYKDITYFPMTYYDCRFLGVETEWKESEGLNINATGVSGAYSQYKAASKNKKSYSVTIPKFSVYVNGTKVDNSKEQYPLLTFRDVTYFPMTWKWGVNSFNWDYSFDSKTGLVIKSDNNQISQTATLPGAKKYTNQQDINTIDAVVCVVGDFVYYQGAKGQIIQAPLSDVTKGKKVYDLPIWSYSNDQTYVYAGLSNTDGKALLYYHQGGAIMGSDFRIELNEDGSTRQIQGSYHYTQAIGDDLYSYWMGGPPEPGDLHVRKGPNAENKEYVTIGDENYWYSPLNPNGKSFDVLNNQLYVSVAKVTKDDEGYISYENRDFKLGRVDLSNNKTTQIGSKSMSYAQLDGNYIYYASDNMCYRINPATLEETLVGTVPSIQTANYFAVAGGLAYCAGNDGQLYKYGDNNPINKGGKVDSLRMAGDNGEYVVCTFQETSEAKYRLMVFDKAGNIVFKSADKTLGNNVTIQGATLYYYNPKLQTICYTSL